MVVELEVEHWAALVAAPVAGPDHGEGMRVRAAAHRVRAAAHSLATFLVIFSPQSSVLSQP